MATRQEVDWPTCDQDGCIGIRLKAVGRCLAHVRDRRRNAALGDFAQSGKIDARGVPISDKLFEQILERAPDERGGHPILTEARFDDATFEGYAEFGRVIFKGRAGFGGATFNGGAGFSEATFKGGAGFSGAAFKGDAQFVETIFEGSAEFFKATFESAAQFGETTFKSGASFYGVTFKSDAMFFRTIFKGGEAIFAMVTFNGDAWFLGATFENGAQFGEATFEGDARFGETTFTTIARFGEATFKRERQFGPVLATLLDLDGVHFAQAVQIEASTIGLFSRRARFDGGAQFRLRWASVVLDDSDLSAPSLLTGIPRMASDAMAAREQDLAKAWKESRFADHICDQPRLLSLQRANVAGLGLGNVNLAECRFDGAHNLDKLRLEADVAFGLSPARLGWERRQVIAEEVAWRASRTRPGLWTDPCWPDWAGDNPAALTADAITGIYRALRKGREDIRDEPGAADFYYGEMEMRRYARGQTSSGSRGQVERGVLTAYWLVSGYGLRAWRALAWFAGLAGAFAFAFHLVGFVQPPQPVSYWTSLLYAFRSTISLTDSEVTLTAWGQLLQSVLRLTGPVLLGLALLALRGRIKR